MKTPSLVNASLGRRQFIKASLSVSGGLMVGFSLNAAAQQDEDASQSRFNAFIEIGTDNTVTLQIHKPENGQGAVTALSMILAEELGCDWNSIRWEFAPIARVYGFPLQGTFGSLGVRSSWQPLREAGAAARQMLVQVAATSWGVAPQRCTAGNSMVIGPNGETLSYGALAPAAALLEVPENLVLKSRADYSLVGKAMKRLDTPAKISGQAQYGIDVRVPDMAYAVLARSPVFGGTVNSFDDSRARQVPGVLDVLEVSRGIAVVAENNWAAMEGRKALVIDWDEGPNATLSSAGILAMQQELIRTPGAVARDDGNAAALIASAPNTISADYYAPYLAHTTMEPPNTVADVREDSCELWTGSQIPGIAHLNSVAASGLSPEQVKVHTQYIGGGFGSRGGGNVYGEAVEISRAAGRPVNLLYTREDDIQQDRYRPASLVQMSAALDAQGWPVAWTGHVSCQHFQALQNGLDREAVAGLANVQYSIPNMHFEYSPLELDVPTNFWRSVGASQNTYFAEVFLDEMARAGGKDPVELRRHLLGDSPRLLNVLNVAAQRAGWGGDLPAGHFQGVALASVFGSFNAQIAEISISQGRLTVHRVTCVVDCGQVINPATVQQQMQGGIVYGLTAALKGEITLENGRVQQSNFHNYDALRMDEMPYIDVVIIDSEVEAPGGIGETATPAIAPAVVNAIYAATGTPVRKLPVTPEDLV